MKVAVPRMTLEEWERLPNDGNRYELIDGELYVTPAPRTRHQIVQMRLSGALHAFAEAHELGTVMAAPTDVALEPASQTRVEPDILFVTREREHIIEEKLINGPPDLVVEILSESTHWVDLQDKRDPYRRSGVQEYWVVDPDQNHLLVYRFAEGPEPRKLSSNEKLATPLLPGLELDLQRIFRK